MIKKNIYLVVISLFIIVSGVSYGQSAPSRLMEQTQQAFKKSDIPVVSVKIKPISVQKISPDTNGVSSGPVIGNNQAGQAARESLKQQNTISKSINNKPALQETSHAKQVQDNNKQIITREANEKRQRADNIIKENKIKIANEDKFRLNAKVLEEEQLKKQVTNRILQAKASRAPVSIKKPDKIGVAKGTPQTLIERGADLVKRNGGKNRVSISTPNGRKNIDLAGKPHNVNGIHVSTPHVQDFKNNVIPNGSRAGQVGSRSKLGNTHSDLVNLFDTPQLSGFSYFH